MFSCEECDCLKKGDHKCFRFVRDGAPVSVGYHRVFTSWSEFSVVYDYAEDSGRLPPKADFKAAYLALMARLIRCVSAPAGRFGFTAYGRPETFGYQEDFATWDEFAAAYNRQIQMFARDVPDIYVYQMAYAGRGGEPGPGGGAW